MSRFAWLLAACVLGLAGAPRALAHDTPFSRVDLRLRGDGVEAVVQAPASLVGARKDGFPAVVASGLILTANNRSLRPEPGSATVTPDGKTIALTLRFPWESGPPPSLHVRCRLFPEEAGHRTLLSLYDGETLQRQEILDENFAEFEYRRGGQGVLEVIGKFVASGVHHIFLGPDHILFIVALLLLGGTLGRLLKIVTAFTVAHSVTLVLAALNLLNPPAQIIEPIIALSIVCVGADNLMATGKERDIRALLAFGFGFIHGFGFAGVLRELDLPPHALGWSLFSFNVGVEIGQACIVLALAPLLAAIRSRNALFARRIAVAGSICVIAAGAIWFVERVRFPG